jgi:hypothetical protein
MIYLQIFMKIRSNNLLVLCVVVLLVQPFPLPKSFSQADARYFPETGKTVSGGFLDYWRSNGGLEQQGYPVSDVVTEKSDVDGKAYTTQYFERAVFESHPENGAPYDILLSLLGSLRYREIYPSGASGQVPNNAAGGLLFPETGKGIGGVFLDYWKKHGGLAQQGYPISDEFNEVSPLDGKQYKVQYFERAVFELHPENAGTQYEVLLSQLGTLRWREKQGSANPTAAPVLPPVPSGVPGFMSMGLLNGTTADIPFSSSVRLDYRYQYLAGGVGTGKGWASWDLPEGQYVSNYLTESNARNLSTAFVYYQLLQSAPHYEEYSNLNDPAVMRAYFDDFKLLMQKIEASSPRTRVLINIEPDLNGVMQQRSTNRADDASLQRSSVASSGQADVQGYPNTFRGYYQALAHIRDVYAPSVLLGIDVSNWAAGDDVTTALRTNPAYEWSSHALRTARYLNSLGTSSQFEMLFYSPLDRDAGYYQVQHSSDRWWDDANVKQPTFSTMGAWLGMIVSTTGRRAMLWQVPNGNRVYRTENNTTGHWQDNRPEYFLNPASGRAHLAEWANLGVVGIMWGAGAGSQTRYYDANNDGITNPAAINGNTAVSSYPDDDGGYLRLQLSSYYASSPLTLPGPMAQPLTATSLTNPR